MTREAEILALLDRKYVARSDDRQKAMGLAYITAERRDLAKEIAQYLALDALAALTPAPSGDWVGDKEYWSAPTPPVAGVTDDAVDKALDTMLGKDWTHGEVRKRMRRVLEQFAASAPAEAPIRTFLQYAQKDHNERFDKVTSAPAATEGEWVSDKEHWSAPVAPAAVSGEPVLIDAEHSRMVRIARLARSTASPPDDVEEDMARNLLHIREEAESFLASAPVADAVKAEREACAKIAKDFAKPNGWEDFSDGMGNAAQEISKLINARSEP